MIESCTNWLTFVEIINECQVASFWTHSVKVAHEISNTSYIYRPTTTYVRPLVFKSRASKITVIACYLCRPSIL